MTGKKGPKTKVDELKEALERKKNAPVRQPQETTVDHDLEDLTAQITAAEEEAKSHYDKMLRMMAELENFKKRTERENSELVKFSNEKLVTELIVVLDDIDRVMEHVPEGASQELVDFVSGVELVGKHLKATLEKNGLEEIKAGGELFNPEYHEAVAHIPDPKVKPDHIIDVHRKGYILNGRVIRAAMVTVSKGREGDY